MLVRNFNENDNSKNNYDSLRNSEIINLDNNDNSYQTIIDLNCTFNKKKLSRVKIINKDNDLKCKKIYTN